ncbi:MAG TPA: glycine oxidase ThiO [Candidatus Nitrosotenuis sp.]|nr:glycine oxidase ThiO [Candidatus Nitrosotenuis sp.]
MKTVDVIVVGGGLIGGAIALRLARRKIRVLVLDRQPTGREASWAAAGMLTPSPETPDSIALVPLARASLDLYPEFVTEVEELSGQTTGFRTEGILLAFFAEDARRELNTFIALSHGVGLSAEAMSVGEARQMEPALNPVAKAAVFLPDEGTVDNRALTRATLAAAAAAGAQVRADARVTSITLEGNRCTGVRASCGNFSAASVVIAAGCYSARIQGVERLAPVRPVRGQMVALRPAAFELGRPIRSERGYLVPRDDGRILAGSTLENAGFDKHVTPAGLKQILSAAIELSPGLADAPIIESWAGLRPDTPDHLPILGPADISGLLLATGHYRNGILLAPITAELICDWIANGTTMFQAEPFSPLRFLQNAARAGAD